MDHFDHVLAPNAVDPNHPVERATLLTDAERDGLRGLGRGREPPLAADLIAAFARNAQQTPTRVAVESGELHLTYAELDGVTNRLARRLQRLGVTREARVAVAMPRGLGELCAFLATLKALGAYVPIDPGHPVERVRVILEDAEPQVLIAPPGSPLRGALPDGVPCLELEDPLTEGLEESSDELGLEPTDNLLAYILFTSGSTGRPKGVEIPRSALANFLQSMAAEPGLVAADRVIAITTSTFDIAGLELFLPLYVGATVVIADRETATDPLRLRALLATASISVLQATPATWRLLLDAGWSGHRTLKMLCGGEAMSLALAQRLLACGAELWNVYGPTETTVYSTLEHIPQDVERITIGHPIDHTVVELRDQGGARVPRGTIGEIWIGGRGLARGYRGRPELTAERFPIDPRTEVRHYRTGDLGRFLADGRLECLGRVDHQIKIRGFRIEPADIETQLRRIAGVSEVLVVAVRRGEDDTRLVAYWVGKATQDALHERARTSLPPYMVPSTYVHLEAFPLTTSGKIDRMRLPAPEERSDDDPGTAPRDDDESAVAAIWRDIVGLPFVPVDRDFFSLGGTSIGAIQMRSQIQAKLKVNLPLLSLFDHPTVESIVAQLRAAEQVEGPIVTWLVRGDARAPWLALMGIHLYEDIARALPAGESLLGMHIPVRYVPGADPFPTVPELARLYLRTIREHQPNGPYHLLGLCHGGVVAFEAAAQLEASGARVAAVVLLDADLPAVRRLRPWALVQHTARKLATEPRSVLERIVRRAGNAPLVGRLLAPFPPSAAMSTAGQAVDMPFDGPEIEAELRAYQALNRRVECDVVVLRATSNSRPRWLALDPDLGWRGRAARVYAHDIPCSHLGMVREPHAAEVARLLVEARRRAAAVGDGDPRSQESCRLG